MKYFRPQIEVEAMKFFDEDVFLVEFPDGTQLKMDSVDFARDFRKMNGQDPVKLRKKPERKKVNYQSSAQAPDLGGKEPVREGIVVLDGDVPGFVEPAQEYDHQ